MVLTAVFHTSLYCWTWRMRSLIAKDQLPKSSTSPNSCSNPIRIWKILIPPLIMAIFEITPLPSSLVFTRIWKFFSFFFHFFQAFRRKKTFSLSSLGNLVVDFIKTKNSHALSAIIINFSRPLFRLSESCLSLLCIAVSDCSFLHWFGKIRLAYLGENGLMRTLGHFFLQFFARHILTRTLTIADLTNFAIFIKKQI